MSRLFTNTGAASWGDSSSAAAAGTGAAMSLFEQCAVETDGDQTLMLQCVANGLEQQSAVKASDLDEWLLVFAGGLVFFMQVGVSWCVLGVIIFWSGEVITTTIGDV